MIRRPPISTLLTHSFPTRRSSDLKLTAEKAGHILSNIRPTLNYGDFLTIDIGVEAVVENPKIKKSVLAEVESKVKEGTIIASNTSSISIDELATAMKHPENFLGMHFFNPVHRMPLVEVIYGEKTSKEAIATVAAYAAANGKTQIVVKNRSEEHTSELQSLMRTS